MKTIKEPKPDMEYDLYLRVVAMDAEGAKRTFGFNQEPVDLGLPSRPERYRDGARVWGFPSRPETAEERATRIWNVAHGIPTEG